MTRPVPAVLLVLLALAIPAQAAAKPALTIKTPNAGDITLAHVVVDTKGGTGAPKFALANKKKLSKQVTVAGGVRKLKKNRFLASIVVVRKTPGSAGAAPAFNLVKPKGVTSWKLTSIFARNILGSNLSPKFCSAIPQSFGHVAKKPIAGTDVPRFGTQELVIAAYNLDCPSGYDDFETKNLQAALRGEPQPSTGGPGDGGGDEGEDDGDGGGGVPTSSTLQGSGTVTSEGNSVHRFELTFNEPVNAFDISVAGSSIDCPNQYDTTGRCDFAKTASGGGVSLPCRSHELVYEFGCAAPASHGSPPTPVPANTVITGRFSINAGSVQQGKVTMTAYSSSGKSQPITLTVQP